MPVLLLLTQYHSAAQQIRAAVPFWCIFVLVRGPVASSCSSTVHHARVGSSLVGLVLPIWFGLVPFPSYVQLHLEQNVLRLTLYAQPEGNDFEVDTLPSVNLESMLGGASERNSESQYGGASI